MKDHQNVIPFFAKTLHWADDEYKESRATFWKKILGIHESILMDKNKGRSNVIYIIRR
jgi:hypothetical protein